MKIIRANHPGVMEYIKPLLLDDVLDGKKDQFVQYVTMLMRDLPDDVFLLVAIESTDMSDSVVGFMIAWAPRDVDYACICQTWVDPIKCANTRTADIFFLRLVQWAENKGKSSIRMETKRNDAAFTRRWGFEVASYNMELRLSGGFEENLLSILSHSQLVKEVGNEHGRIEGSVGTIGTTEGGGVVPGTVHESERVQGLGEEVTGRSNEVWRTSLPSEPVDVSVGQGVQSPGSGGSEAERLGRSGESGIEQSPVREAGAADVQSGHPGLVQSGGEGSSDAELPKGDSASDQ